MNVTYQWFLLGVVAGLGVCSMAVAESQWGPGGTNAAPIGTWRAEGQSQYPPIEKQRIDRPGVWNRQSQQVSGDWGGGDYSSRTTSGRNTHSNRANGSIADEAPYQRPGQQLYNQQPRSEYPTTGQGFSFGFGVGAPTIGGGSVYRGGESYPIPEYDRSTVEPNRPITVPNAYYVDIAKDRPVDDGFAAPLLPYGMVAPMPAWGGGTPDGRVSHYPPARQPVYQYGSDRQGDMEEQSKPWQYGAQKDKLPSRSGVMVKPSGNGFYYPDQSGHPRARQ